MSKEFTIEDVKAHTDKNDLFLVVHGKGKKSKWRRVSRADNGKVYNVSSFLDEHPGGEEVMIDVAGMDASDAFEDVGHSDEAREQLETMLIGTLKEDPNAPKISKTAQKTVNTASANPAANMGVMVLVVALLAAAVYKFAL